MLRNLVLALFCLALTRCSQMEPGPGQRFDQSFAVSGDFAGSHIMVTWQGASGAPAELVRTPDEALARAQELAAVLQTDPGLFEQLARDESDAPDAVSAGRLRPWKEGELVPELNQAFADLKIGQISPKPIASPFGWHILRRDPLCVPHYGYESFYVAFKGSDLAPAGVTRDRVAARQIAEQIAPQLKPGNFAALAHKYNDYADGPLPLEVSTQWDSLPPDMLARIAALDFDGVTGPVELPVGFAFFRRIQLQQRAASHILISFMEAPSAKTSISRERAEARTIIKQLLAQLAADPHSFEALAREFSDAPDAVNGGQLKTWFRGRMEPQFELALDSLAEGQITTSAVETVYGFHLIRRDPVESPCP